MSQVVEPEVVSPIQAPKYQPDYSAQTKAETIALAKATSAYKAYQQTGIPWQTIYRWMGAEDHYSEVVQAKQGDLALKLENIAHSSADLLQDGRLNNATIRELLGAIHISVPAMQLLRGLPTSIIESREVESRQVLALLIQAIAPVSESVSSTERETELK